MIKLHLFYKKNNIKNKKGKKKNDTKDETSTNNHLQENNGWSYFGKFNPAIQINKTLKRSVLRQKTCFELQVSCGDFVITLRMQSWS